MARARGAQSHSLVPGLLRPSPPPNPLWPSHRAPPLHIWTACATGRETENLALVVVGRDPRIQIAHPPPTPRWVFWITESCQEII